MIAQASFMVAAPIRPDRVSAMRELLATMNLAPGRVDPSNALVPFAKFDNLHTARLVVLDDQTIRDPQWLYGVQRPDPPIYLAFLGDFDGDYSEFMSRLAMQAGDGLRRIFALCEGWSATADLLAWMKEHEQPAAAYYCNWVGRTVRQAREEEQLRRAVLAFLQTHLDIADSTADQVHQALRRFVGDETAAGRLTLSPADGPSLRNALLAWCRLLLVLPLGVLVLPILILLLLRQEASAPEYAPRPEPQVAKALGDIEDHDFTNQFSAMGSWQPGFLRKLAIPIVVWLIDAAARAQYTKGRLTRVYTIQFARWVYLDNRTRLFFASIYDGSLESYNEDFINKISIGLNIVFGNGVGYPRTRWLLGGGAKDEQPFKYFLRRHELATEVFYNAHDGMTAHDLQRNSMIREKLDKPTLTADEAREWVALL